MNQLKVRYEWDTIPWRKLEKNVFKLQKRIYQASKHNQIKKMHNLQRLLLNSTSAKLLAVRRVTQDNRGKRTAGIDGKANLNPRERIQLAYTLDWKEKADPSKRIWILKPGKDEKRPLGIPTIKDRAKQTLVKMTLEPEWEAKFDPNKYGFRPGRSCHDAITAIFLAVSSKQTTHVLETDISGCFENLNHETLLRKLNTYPTITRVIKGWLRAGIMEGNMFQLTEQGTIQGGTISPLLANIALNGIEQHVKEALVSELYDYRKRKTGRADKKVKQSISIVFYADDMVALHESKEIVLKAKMLIEAWLKDLGLALKASKTRISHTLQAIENKKPGFDFLGFTLREYPTKRCKKGRVLLSRPSVASIGQHKLKIKQKLKAMRGSPPEAVIKELNPIIRGWSSYYRTGASSDIFNSLNMFMYRRLWKWSVYRHPNKGGSWIKRKYFREHGKDNWRFKVNDKICIIKHSEYAIRRHIPLKVNKSPYDGDWTYWTNRLSRLPEKSPRVIRLMKSQEGSCAYCKLKFRSEDLLETHHKDQNKHNNTMINLSLLHRHCHDQVHKRRYA